MSDFSPPLQDYEFLLGQAGLARSLQKLWGGDDFDLDDLKAILQEGGKFSREVLAPANLDGDQIGAKLENGMVRLPDSFIKAFDQFKAAGWTGLSFEPEQGGQGLPWTLAASVFEMFQGANLAWALNSLLTIGAAEAIAHHGNDAQKQQYLNNMVEGKWCGTMNLTEPQAGSDLGKIRTKATPRHSATIGDHYLIKGQKIFITYGDHEAYENIIHMVLAKAEGAPEGTAGISLFIVPKYLVNADGSLGARNDVKAIALESKLGIHGSPTCVMAFGEDQGAIGFLVGEENNGLAQMFTMMNLARLMVGVQGLGIAERAYQKALTYAKDRKQGRHGKDKDVPIIRHLDVKRMLMDMLCRIQAMRAMLMEVMLAFDTTRKANDDEWKSFAQRRVDLMVPVLKSWFTDNGVEIASLGIQVHGGAGFIELTGAAQHYRDARILPIYEGTNGIQALDLVGRKIVKDQGKAAHEYLEEANIVINRLNKENDPYLVVIRKHLAAAIDALDEGVSLVLSIANTKSEQSSDQIGALAVDLNHLFGIVSGGIALTNAILNAQSNQTKALSEHEAGELLRRKKIARYYAEAVLTLAPALLAKISHAPHVLLEFNSEQM